MRKITYHQKKKKIQQYKSWIAPLEERLFRLENIKSIAPADIEKCNFEIKKQHQGVFRHYKEHSRGEPPAFVDDQPLDQSGFADIGQAKAYIESVLYKAYDVMYYGNIYINALVQRVWLEIELMEDHSVEILNLKSKLDKHKSKLEKVQAMDTASQKKIEDDFKIKEDHLRLINATQQKLEKKHNTLKTHLYRLNQIRAYASITNQIREGTYVKKEFEKNDEFFTAWSNRILNSSSLQNKNKVKKWIRANITEIRKIKSKLLKQQLKYEEYLLQSGSEGEKEIRYFFIKNNIVFEEQKRFVTCVDRTMLPFDFFIKEYKTLIEFDGAQHFMPIALFGGEDGFIDRQRKDEIKTNWARINGFRLVRIRFDEDLNKALLNLKSSLF